jgi:GDSL-like Lipase/Acylhydrolase family
LALLGWLAIYKSSEPTILGRYSFTYFALLIGVAALVIVSLLAQATFFYRRLHKVRREIILVLSSILVSLITIEVAIRVFDPLGISYFRESSRYQLDLIPDPILVFKHTPGLQRIYQRVSVSINELGLRDRDLEKKKRGELRILLLGDSVTFGWGVPVETTFGRKLETLLTAKLGRPVRTVNSGVGGYNTVQEQAFIRTYIDVIEPDTVILLFVRNDIELNEPPFDPWSQLALQGKTPPEIIRILLGESWLYRLGVFALKYSRPRGLTSLNKNTRGLRESMNALSSIATLCLERNVSFVVFFYPGGRAEAAQSLSHVALLSEILSIGNKYGFPVVDIGTWWGQVEMRSITNSIVDPHPNKRGHDILAVGMADFLLAHGLIRRTQPDAR